MVGGWVGGGGGGGRDGTCVTITRDRITSPWDHVTPEIKPPSPRFYLQ